MKFYEAVIRVKVKCAHVNRQSMVVIADSKDEAFKKVQDNLKKLSEKYIECDYELVGDIKESDGLMFASRSDGSIAMYTV